MEKGRDIPACRPCMRCGRLDRVRRLEEFFITEEGDVRPMVTVECTRCENLVKGVEREPGDMVRIWNGMNR